MKRRSFLKVVGSTAGGLAVGVPHLIAQQSATAVRLGNELPRRVLGRTGWSISIVGFPGLAMVHADQETGNAGVKRAMERGVNYYDVAPAYGNGDAEIKLGVALQGIDRNQYYLACKTKKRDKEGARAELERSLQRLKTDHFDLYQLHHLVRPDEVKQALGPDGAMETILKAKQEGKIRRIGFSAHTTKAALEALNGFAFDTVMFPINYVEYYTRDFGKEVLKVAQEKGTAVLAIKPMNGGSWAPGEQRHRDHWYKTLETQQDINLALRWTLSLPGVASGFPPAFIDLLDKAVTAVHECPPITEPESKKLQEIATGKGSIFKGEEDSVALGIPYRSPYPEHAHEGCPGMWA